MPVHRTDTASSARPEAGVRQNARFRRLWGSVGASLLGTEITAIARPVTAVAVLDASAGQVALLAAAGTAPFLLLGLPAGAWVDLWPRRTLRVWGDRSR